MRMFAITILAALAFTATARAQDAKVSHGQQVYADHSLVAYLETLKKK